MAVSRVENGCLSCEGSGAGEEVVNRAAGRSSRRRGGRHRVASAVSQWAKEEASMMGMGAWHTLWTPTLDPYRVVEIYEPYVHSDIRFIYYFMDVKYVCVSLQRMPTHLVCYIKT
jgi:hypothetical protein